MEKLNIEQGTPEWLALRKNHLGSSDASIIMGASKWKISDGRIKTPYLLWKEKLGLEDLSCDNAATRYGKVMEEPARQAYQEMVGDIVEPVCVKNTQHPYLLASLDGLNITEDRAVEIKNCNFEDHKLAKEGKIPSKYYPQVQLQIMVTGLPFIDYFSFHKGDGVIVKVERDEEYILDLSKKLDAFWKCVETLKEPPLTDDDFIERDNIWEETAEKLFTLKEDVKFLEKEVKKTEELLKNMSEGKNSRSGSYRYSFTSCRGSINYKLIPELHKINLNKYRNGSIIKWSLKKDSCK